MVRPFEHLADYKPKGPSHCFHQFNGDYTFEIWCDQVPAMAVADRYPPDGWSYRIEHETNHLHIRVEGQAGDRLLVLE